MGERRGCSRGGATARAAVISAVMSAIVVIAGCSSGGGSAAPFPTSSPSAKPTAATEQVESTVRAFYAAMDRAVRTGDASGYKSMTTNECACRKFVATLAKRYAPGRYPGAGVTLVEIDAIETHSSYATADAVYATSAYVEVRHGHVVRRFERNTKPVTLTLVPGHARWLVAASIDRSAT